MNDVYRRCEFLNDDPTFSPNGWDRGLFHAWAGLSEYPMAIVENLNGDIFLIKHDNIRFTDTLKIMEGMGK